MELLLILGKKRGRQRKQAPESLLPRATPDTWLDLEPMSPPCHMTLSHHSFSEGEQQGPDPTGRGMGTRKEAGQALL